MDFEKQPAPVDFGNQPDLTDFGNQLENTQRTIIFCTIFLVAAVLIILPPLIWIYIRPTHKKITKLIEKLDNCKVIL